MFPFARILIDRSEGRELDYSIPEVLRAKVSIGSRAVVMVRKRRVVGTVLKLMDHPDVTETKPILGLVGDESSITPLMMQLASWMADYYCAPFASVMRLSLIHI